MSYGLNSFGVRTKLIAGALALVIAGVSHADSATLVGGGATLPSIGYVGTNAALMTQVDGSNIDPTSLFGVALPNVSYCLTGSGAGKNILAGITNSNVQNNCPTGPGALSGFGAPAVSRTDLTQPSFAGADAPMSATDYSNYKSVHTASTANPTEFPAVAGAVAIPFNLVDSLSNTVTSSEVNFTSAQLCLIFSGQASNWNDSRLASAFHLTDGGSIVPAPINVQFRSDGSGTTFSFSNHLAAACNTTTNPLETSQNFFSTTATPYVVQNFFSAGAGVPNGDGVTTPKWTGSSGNPAVANAVKNTPNSIGYVETANALATAPNLQFADVDSTSPIDNFSQQLVLSVLSVANNQVIGAANNANGTPTLQAISGATGSCIKLVRPSDYALANNNPGNINPAGNYPIVAISYLLGNTSGNGADLANTRTLLNAPYDATVQGEVTTIGGTTGLQFLNVSAAFSTTAAGTCLAD
jgi:phosphate transport system substrate-binding protein